MADVTVRLKIGGLNKLMRSAGVQAVVDREGRRMADAAGPNFEYVARNHRWTARGYVQPANPEGMREQRRNAVLERALGSR